MKREGNGRLSDFFRETFEKQFVACY